MATLTIVENTDQDRNENEVVLPNSEKARLSFRIGPHQPELSADEIDSRDSWQCCAGKAPCCGSEGTAESMKVAVTSGQVAMVLCHRHAIALHKAGEKDGKRINTRRSLRQYLAGRSHDDRKVDDSPLDCLRQEDARTLRFMQAAVDVEGLIDEF